MLINPISPSHKYHARLPLLIALLLTGIIHAVLILSINIDFEQIKANYRTITVSIIKSVTPKKEKPIPVPKAPTATAPAQTVPTPAVAKNSPPPAKAVKKQKRKRQHSSVRAPVFPVVEPKLPSVPEPEPIPEKTAPAIPEAPVSAPPPVVEPTSPPEVPAPVIPEPAVESVPSIDASLPAPETTSIDKAEKETINPGKKSRKHKKATKHRTNTTDAQLPTLSMDDLAAQIAQVGEKYANPTENSASRIKSLKNIRGHKFSARQYISDWQHKVERIGNLNYPEIAKEKDFSARLSMEVGIRADGSIDHIVMRKSSGIPELDEAAKAIVRMGEPYSPLPKDLTEELDVLVIQRNWQFSDESGMTSR